jgi:hypothetical protein
LVNLKTKSAGDGYPKKAIEKTVLRFLGSRTFSHGLDPNEAQKCVVAHGKSYLAAPGPSLGYTLKGGRFAWAGRSSLSPEDLGAPPSDADQRSAREAAQEFLLQTLADRPKPSLDVLAHADKQRISRASLRRAKGDLGVKAKKTPDHWEWSLPRPLRDAGGGQDAQTPEGDHLEHLNLSLG